MRINQTGHLKVWDDVVWSLGCLWHWPDCFWMCRLLWTCSELCMIEVESWLVHECHRRRIGRSWLNVITGRFELMLQRWDILVAVLLSDYTLLYKYPLSYEPRLWKLKSLRIVEYKVEKSTKSWKFELISLRKPILFLHLRHHLRKTALCHWKLYRDQSASKV